MPMVLMKILNADHPSNWTKIPGIRGYINGDRAVYRASSRWYAVNDAEIREGVLCGHRLSWHDHPDEAKHAAISGGEVITPSRPLKRPTVHG